MKKTQIRTKNHKRMRVVDQYSHSVQRYWLIDHPAVDPITGNQAQLHVHYRIRIQKDIPTTKKENNQKRQLDKT